MDKYINISIYLIYGIIAMVSVGVALQTSLIIAGIVLALEGVRIIAIYKKLYLAILIVLIGNICLIWYNSSKTQELIEYNQAQIKFVNEKTKNTLDNTFQAKNVSNLSSNVKEITKISIDWWFMVGAYLFLEITLLIVIIGINKQEKQIAKPKSAKYTGKPQVREMTRDNKNKELKSVDISQEKPIDNDKLEYVGSFRDYAKIKGIPVRKAQEEFEIAKVEGRLIKQNGKNYLRG